MIISSIHRKVSLIFEYLANIVLPKEKEVEDLENLDLEKWKKTASFKESEETVYFLSYKDQKVRKAIWEIKYRQNRKIRETISKLLGDFLMEELAEKISLENFTDPIITFIPMSKKRISEREINQSEVLAKDISTLLKIPFSKTLVKNRETKRQTTLKRSERLSNVKNSFGVLDAKNISGKNIIIIDDVVTTGATLREAKKVLIHAGARKVLCVAIAH